MNVIRVIRTYLLTILTLAALQLSFLPIQRVGEVSFVQPKPQPKVVQEDVVNPIAAPPQPNRKVRYVAQFTTLERAEHYVSLADKYATEQIDVIWLLAMMRTESTYNEHATSSEGAEGLMQVLPSTARAFNIDSSTLYDPEVSVRFARDYLIYLIGQTGSFHMAIIAYNQGEGNVRKGTYRTWYYDKVKAHYDEIQAFLQS